MYTIVELFTYYVQILYAMYVITLFIILYLSTKYIKFVSSCLYWVDPKLLVILIFENLVKYKIKKKLYQNEKKF